MKEKKFSKSITTRYDQDHKELWEAIMALVTKNKLTRSQAQLFFVETGFKSLQPSEQEEKEQLAEKEEKQEKEQLAEQEEKKKEERSVLYQDMPEANLDDLVFLQECLLKLGYLSGPGVSQEFDIGVQDAVAKFQKDVGLSSDGRIGIDTWKLLQEKVAKSKE